MIAPPFAIFFGLLTLFATHRLARRVQPGSETRAVLLAGLSVPLLYWTFGGLESSLVAFLVVCLALSIHDKKMLQACSFCGLLILARPEIPAVLICATALGWATTRDRLYGQVAIAAVAVTILVVLWRLWYFGVPFPNPVLAKVGGLRLPEGLHYAMLNAPVFIMGSAAFWLRGPSRCVAALGTAIAAFVIAVGGDWMEGGRFLVPAVPLAAVSLARFRYGVFGVPFNLAWLAWFTATQSTGTPIWKVPNVAGVNLWERGNRVHLRDVETSRRMMVQARGKTILTSQLGMVAYYTARTNFPRVRIVDKFALCDRELMNAPGAKSAFGRNVKYIDAIRLVRPDIVFDLGTPQIVAPDFEVTFFQRGNFGNVEGQEFIAVRHKKFASQLYPRG